jgi:hypothetical protein
VIDTLPIRQAEDLVLPVWVGVTVDGVRCTESLREFEFRV